MKRKRRQNGLGIRTPNTFHNKLTSKQQRQHCYEKSSDELVKSLECGPMPSVMFALPNVGGALCSTPESLADAHYLTVVQ